MSSIMYTIGLRSARTHRSRLQVTSNNLANADTEGYSRQSVRLSPAHARLGYGRSVGLGVDASNPTRQEDASIQRTLRDTGEQSGFFRGAARLLSHAESTINDEGGHPVGQALDTFFQRVGETTVNVTSTPNRQALLDAADRLAISIRDSYANMDRVRNEADAQVTDTVEEINILTARIANLNQSIEDAENVSTQAPELRDERDRALLELSQLLDVQVLAADNGMVNVQTNEGYLLVGGPESNNLDVQVNPLNNGHLDIIMPSRPAGPNFPSSELGGFLGGLIEARDGAIQRQQAALDDLAFDLANAVNTALAGGTDLNGNPGVALFNVSATRAGAGRSIDLNAAVRNQPDALALSGTGAVGDNTVALTIGTIEEQNIIGTTLEKPSDAVAFSLYDLADASRDAKNNENEAEIIFAETQMIRDSILGVSVDEELVYLTEAQRAFQGAAKILTTADEVMQEIMGLKR